jgi:hypothetical protein
MQVAEVTLTVHLRMTRAAAEDCNPTCVERLVSHPSEIRQGLLQRSENPVVVTRGSQLTARSRRGYEDVFTRVRGKVRRLVRATANVGMGYLHFVGEKKQNVTSQSNSRGMVVVSMGFVVYVCGNEHQCSSVGLGICTGRPWKGRLSTLLALGGTC